MLVFLSMPLGFKHFCCTQALEDFGEVLYMYMDAVDCAVDTVALESILQITPCIQDVTVYVCVSLLGICIHKHIIIMCSHNIY